MKHGPWVLEYRCIECKTTLTGDERLCNNGICPHCGYKDDSNHYAKSTKHIRRRVYTTKRVWWFFTVTTFTWEYQYD